MRKLVEPAAHGATEFVERIGFYLSAFLSASRSIDNRLRRENGATYLAWRTAWDARLSQEHHELIKAMVDDRNLEVHESGSAADPRQSQRPVGPGTYDLGPGGRTEVVGPPGVFPLATFVGTELWLNVAEKDRRVLEVCAEYLTLLEEMIEGFETAPC